MTRVHVMHASMQFNDSDAQKRSDIGDIFERAEKRKVSWITGTEAGEQPMRSIIKAFATEYGFAVHTWRDNWICVRKTIIARDSWDHGDVFVAKASETAGPGHDSGFPWVQFRHLDLGVISVAAGHYPTKGASPGDPNYQINRRYAKAIGDWARTHGDGLKLAFYHGDQNVDDRKLDTFYGQPMLSLWDELGKHESTGHGNIDVIAHYTKDTRVTGAYIRALDDTEFSQFADHFVVEGGYDIEPLKKK